MNASQRRVFNFVSNHLVASAGEIAHALDTTVANARYHLNTLSFAGLIARAGERHDGERGRPVQLYKLGRLALGDGFPFLCSKLLSLLHESVNPEDLSESMRDLARLMIKTEKLDKRMPIMERLAVAMAWLNNHQYQARWEARAEGAHIVINNCPFAAIIESHPELCKLDGHIIEGWLDLPVVQKEKLMRSAQGVTACLFVLV